MSTQAAQSATPQGGGNAQQPQQPGVFSTLIQNILRMVVLYWIMSYFMGGRGSRQTTVDPKTGKPLPAITCAFPYDQQMDLIVYISSEEKFTYSSNLVPFWKESRLAYKWHESNTRNMSKVLSNEFMPEYYKRLINNETVWLHVFLTKQGVSIDPASYYFDPHGVVYLSKALNRYLPIKKSTAHNLLSGEPEKVPKNEPIQYGSYWNDHLYLQLVDMHDSFKPGSIPPHILPHLKFDATNTTYYPVLFFNEFWLLREKLLLLNDTVKELPITIEFSVLSPMKWMFYSQMDASFKLQESLGAVAEDEKDEIKRMLLETNPVLLGTTILVSLLHSIFEFLAFKNDIQFWREKKSMEGMSVRTLFMNAICQVIIFLYLLDNETSWLIIIGSFVGTIIEFWKISKAVNFKRKPTFPWFTFEDKETYVSKTKEYDDIAMKYLSYALYPLVIIYAIYSLIYHEHKGWYSWILSTLVGFIYMFGFIMMTPQLFINYKLKSVAHLPWRAFVYKALNTFIDDLFAFIIKMPTLHRLSCFRDDIIFFIYLYQRWIYPVDKTRVNEFGQGGEEETDSKPQVDDGKPKTDSKPQVDDGKLKTE